MDKFILSLLLLLIILTSQQALALVITSPVNGATFKEGDTVTIVAELENDDPDIVFVNFDTTKGIGDCPEDIATHPRYVCVFTIPLGSPQSIAIGATGVTVDSFISAPQISINITRPSTAKLQRLSIFNDDELYFGRIGQATQIYLGGIYSDGIERDLKLASAGTTYSSANTIIVTVSPDGLVRSVGPGKTQVTIRNGDQSLVSDAEVLIKIGAPLSLNLKAADVSLQLDWQLSEQDPDWVTEYKVFRSEDPDGLYGKQIGSVSNGIHVYLDTTAQQGRTYYYSVQAYSGSAQSSSKLTRWVNGLRP